MPKVVYLDPVYNKQQWDDGVNLLLELMEEAEKILSKGEITNESAASGF